MTWDALQQLVTDRRSIRRFDDRPVPEEWLLKAVELATWAPNSGGKQGWHFTVVTNRGLVREVAEAVQGITDLMATWPEAEPLQTAMERWKLTCAFFRSAPALIAVSMGTYLSVTDQVCEARSVHDPVAAEILSGRRIGASRVQTAAAAVCILLLALHQQGLGATWMAGPQQAKRQVEEILGIPDNYEFVALVPVGYPAETPAPRPRRALSDVVKVLR